jgi:hypothetical protein
LIDAAQALGRVTGLSGRDELIWLRPCRPASVPLAGWHQGRHTASQLETDGAPDEE